MPGAESGILLDTGVLVAVLSEADPRHGAATRWLAQLKARLHTVDAVLTETSFFLPAERRALLAEMAATGAVQMHQPDAAGYKRVSAILRKYADLRPDWADATLVWLAEQTGFHRVATLDVRDFSAYRIHGRSKFMIEPIA
jgi:predicted nucleic acid-binding protein